MSELDKIKLNIRKIIALGAITIGSSIAACVPITERVVYKDAYRVDKVIHFSKEYSDAFIVNFVGWTYKKGDYTYIDSTVFINDYHPKLKELEDGDTLVKRIKQKATLFDLVNSSLIRQPVSSFFERTLEYDVVKNPNDLVPQNII